MLEKKRVDVCYDYYKHFYEQINYQEAEIFQWFGQRFCLIILAVDILPISTF